MSPAARDMLYIARCKSVNTLALPHVRRHDTRRLIVLTLDQLSANRDLPDLLQDAVWPLQG